MFPARFSIILFTIVFIGNLSAYSSAYERDQGPLDKKHVQDAYDFRAQYFFNEKHEVSLEKVDAFLRRIEDEKEQIIKDSYETKIIEKIEQDLVNLEQAKKSAIKQLKKEKNQLIFAYDNYLIPKLLELKQLVEDISVNNLTNQNNNIRANCILDDFIRVYALFYYPTTKKSNPRKAWGYDYDHSNFLKKIRGYKFNKNESEKVEANNLIVEAENIDQIKACISSEILIGHYVSPEEIRKLKACGFDISKMNPGKSPFWERLTQNKIAIIRGGITDSPFPHEEDKLIYKRIDFSGKGSPKVEAYYRKNNKKVKIKIKVGFEVHSEQAAAYFLRFVGFSQDTMKYYKKIKLYLGEQSLTEFFRMYRRRYSFEMLPRYIVEKYEGPGEHWIVLKDVLVESHDPNLVRLGPYDFEGWDLLNRREHRGSMLFYAWLNLMEAVSDNYKMILKKGGKYPKVIYRLHDPGYSLDRSFTIRKLSDVSRIFALNDRNVNMFPATFLSYNSRKVRVWWNDYIFRNSKRFATTTYTDMKWMARKIANIKEEDLLFSLRSSGMPDDVVDLYFHKLRIRRNEVVKAFDLNDEFALFEVPNLKEYSPNKNIKNGKIVKPYYDGHAEFQTRRVSFIFSFFKMIGMSLSFFNLSEKFKFKLNEAQLTSEINPIKVANSKLMPGVSITLGRRVMANPQHWNANGSGHGFAVIDTLNIEVGVGSDYFQKIKSYLPFSLHGHLRTFKTQLSYTHYSDTRREGYFSSFRLLKMIRNLDRAIAFDLQPGEVVSRKDYYGIDLDYHVSAHNPGREVVSTEIAGHVQFFDASPVHYFRDHFGALHIYKEKSRIHSIGSKLYILQFDLGILSLPLIGLESSTSTYLHKAELYTFKLPSYHEQALALTKEQRKKEHRVLKYLRQRKDYDVLKKVILSKEDDLSSILYRDLSMESFGKMKSYKFALLFVGNTKKHLSYSKVNLSLGSDDKSRVFHRYAIERRDYKGFDRIAIPENRDILIPKGQVYSIQVELEEKEIRNIGVHLKIQDYLRKTDRDGLFAFIAEQNKKFSKDIMHPFYSYQMIPNKKDVDIYRKLYSDTNIYISSKGIDRLLTVDPKDIYRKAKKYYQSKLSWRALRLKKKLIKLNKERSSSKDFVTNIGHLLSTLATRKFGVNFLKELVGEEHLHVYGQIYGVYRSFTMLQKSEIKSGLRYTAINWGTFEEVSPIRKLLKKNMLLPNNIFVDSIIEPATFFGRLPKTRPPMF